MSAIEAEFFLSAKVTADDELAAVFHAQYLALCRVAFLMLADRDLAEDVVMDAFVKAYRGWFRIRSLDHPNAYLRQIVVSLCLSRLRRGTAERRARAAMERNATSEEPTAPDDEILMAVRKLPTRQRACVILRYFEDLADEQVARILGCSVGTVKSQLSKARLKLAAELGPQREGGTYG